MRIWIISRREKRWKTLSLPFNSPKASERISEDLIQRTERKQPNVKSHTFMQCHSQGARALTVRGVCNSFVFLMMATTPILQAGSIPVPAQCDQRVYVNPGETVTIYAGSLARHYRLSLILYTGKPDLPPIGGDENKYVGFMVNIDGGKQFPIPYVPGAIDVDSTKIDVVNNTSATTGGKRTYYVCFAHLQQ